MISRRTPELSHQATEAPSSFASWHPPYRYLYLSQVVSPKCYALQAFIELDAADALNEQLQIQFGREPSPALDL
jgi:hypothetical protein